MNLKKSESETFEQFLKDRGYFKYVQHYKKEDYMYWKSFDRIERGKGGYSVGFAFYDFSKYPQLNDATPISISFEFMLGVNLDIDRLDLSVSDDRITVEQFEKFCENFYNFYNKNKTK